MLLPLAPPPPVAADFLDDPVIDIDSAPFCIVELTFEDQGDPELKLNSEPAASRRPFLSVLKAVKL